MALPEQYLQATKKTDAYFNAILNAQAPAKFTQKFLEQLEFKNASDRLFVGILKALKFIDQMGVPQDRYFQFLDKSESKKVLAEAIRDAYSDLFAVNIKANELSATEVRNKMKTLTQGSKSEDTLKWMASTFLSLCQYADFSTYTKNDLIKVDTKQENNGVNTDETYRERPAFTGELINKQITTEMHYNIQIHLPETRDITVYDAIFKSLKEHLL